MTRVVRRPWPPRPSHLLLSEPVLLQQTGRRRAGPPSSTSPSRFPLVSLSSPPRAGLGPLDRVLFPSVPRADSRQWALTQRAQHEGTSVSGARLGTRRASVPAGPVQEGPTSPATTGPSRPKLCPVHCQDTWPLWPTSGPDPAPLLCRQQQQAQDFRKHLVAFEVEQAAICDTVLVPVLCPYGHIGGENETLCSPPHGHWALEPALSGQDPGVCPGTTRLGSSSLALPATARWDAHSYSESLRPWHGAALKGPEGGHRLWLATGPAGTSGRVWPQA